MVRSENLYIFTLKVKLMGFDFRNQEIVTGTRVKGETNWYHKNTVSCQIIFQAGNPD